MKKTLLILALLCAFAQGARAQNEWATVYTQTQTTSVDWTALEASTTGRTLGSADATTYYYASGNLSFTNSTAGGSGLTILGTVYLYVPSGITVTCTGANASGQTGGGAGIELTAGNSLYLIGGGTLVATGGNAANGGNGGNGYDAEVNTSNDEYILGGSGGTGGNGGGGAGAGIGTCGGNGGTGGSGGQRTGSYTDETTQYGVDGNPGSAGSTAGVMGTLYVYQALAPTVNVHGGSQGSNGSGGSRGRTASQHPGSNVYMASGGGGGGAGGFGGAASDIGTGGPGGGGGGGGAAGNVAWVVYSGTLNGYYHAGAFGGDGGKNADGSTAPDGADVELTNPKYADIQGVGLRSSASDYTDDAGWENGNGRHDGGAGGAAGSASVGGSYGTVTLDWTTQENDWGLICFQTGSTRADWVHLADNSTSGKTLGAAGTTTYYYTAFDRTFTNSNAGGSGLTILGTVYLYIPSGKTITCTGTHASGTIGAGAGIELTAGNTLYIIGSGRLVATGGNAANGGNGTNGGNAYFNTQTWVRSGDGGRGGNGGGGGGAGIGTRGGTGGTGGAGGAGRQEDYNETTGNVGSNGQNGGTAAAMGTLYIYDGSQALTPQTDIHGGSQGTSGGNGGAGGTDTIEYHGVYFWTAGGGGGGAGGGFGGAASNIGTGGPGGGGGGGGASGSIASRDGSYETFYQVGAFGGNPGANADGTPAGNGANTLMTTCTVEFTTGGDYDNSFVPTTAGWQNGIDNRAAGGSGGATGSASTGSSANAVAVAWPTQGTGIEGNPFIISSTDDWNGFANAVTGGCTFSGQFVKLDADISVSTMAGTSDANSFQGTFDGDGQTLTFTKGTSAEPFAEEYCAPFRHVKNATIKNLHVAGTIYTSRKKAAGIVGESHGALTLTGCRSSIAINSSVSGDGTHGGLVSTLSGSGNAITIEGCVFDGSFATTAGTNNCGGFIGWPTYNTPTITNSLMKPSSVGAGMVANTFTRVYSTNEPTIVNCYYTEALGTAQGTQAYSISGGTGVTVANAGAVSNNYDVSGLTFYATGLKYGDAHYAGNGDSVSLTLGSPVAASAAEYYASAGTLSGTGNPYTLTMPAADVVINVNVLQAIGAARWYAISTPMHDDGQNYESVGNVTNLTGTAYDLLRYNESSSTWENQKAGSGATGFTTLTPGRGYIYRCSSARTLTYTGEPNSAESYSVSLTRSNNDSPLRGFNLVGNPYPFRVALMRDFYALNADGTWTEHTSGDSLEVGQGALVYTSTNNETLTFYAATRSTSAPLVATALPPLPKGLCLGEDCGEDEPDADEDVRAPRFARWDGDQLVITGEGTLTAYDVMGRMLFSVWANNDSPLRLSQFPSAGVYLLRLNGKTQKIVIR